MSETYPIDETLDSIRSWMRRNGVKQAKMARMADLGATTLNEMMEPEWSPSVPTIRALQRVIEEDPRP